MDLGYRAIFAIAVLGMGCTRPNPGFIDTAGGSGENTNDADATGSEADSDGAEEAGEAGTETRGSTDDGEVDETTDDGEDTSDTEATCSVPPHTPGGVLFTGGASNCADFDHADYRFEGVSGGVMNLRGPCPTETCATCSNEPLLSMSLIDIDLQDGNEGAGELCFHVHAEGPFESPISGSCAYDAVSIWDEELGYPTFAASFNDYGIPLEIADFATDVAEGIDVGLIELEVCECGTDECCDPAEPPTQYEMKLPDGQHVPPGTSVSLELGPIEYQFTNLGSHASGECETPHDVDWALGATGFARVAGPRL